ncbi:MAG TPA: hypothetical protein VFU15_00270 [Bacteroidia bacterium]|nr:hypothetical protein [Bacteroidia bacterium]
MKKTLALFFLLLITQRFFAAPPPSLPMAGGPKFGFSYAGSGVVSFFSVDTRHSDKAVPRAGFGAMFRIHFYPSANAHIQIGLQVMSQSCAFNSYYFAPGYSVLYDKTFGYTHTFRTLELWVPVMARIGLTPGEASARTIFYLLGGYSPKLYLGTTADIVQNATGKEVWGGTKDLQYEHQFLGANTGNELMGGFGFDKRFGFNEKFLSFETIFSYTLSRFIYDLGRTGDNPLYIRNMSLQLQIGYRFAGGGHGGGVN